MIEIDGQVYGLGDPLGIAVLAAAGAVLLVMILLIMAVRASSRSARLAEPLAMHMGQLGQRVQALSDGQQQLAGGHPVLERLDKTARRGCRGKLLEQLRGSLTAVLLGGSRPSAPRMIAITSCQASFCRRVAAA